VKDKRSRTAGQQGAGGTAVLRGLAMNSKCIKYFFDSRTLLNDSPEELIFTYIYSFRIFRTMNCIIVEDAELVRLDFENKVKHVPFLHLVHSCPSAIEASSVIMNNPIDLVVLDVMLPDMDGLQFMKALDRDRPQIILVSSESKYAVDAFEYDVTDFLVKPVSMERFFKAVAKAKKIYDAGSGISSHDDESIFIKVNSRMVRIDTKDIQYVEALSDYVVLYTLAGKFMIHTTMKRMEGALPRKSFFRTHNSYIIRLDKIVSIEDNCLVIADKLIPISRSKMKPLQERLKFFPG
jgi:DNA-binding LytR/AlgR family response regulator